MEALVLWVSQRANVLLTESWSVYEPGGLWEGSRAGKPKPVLLPGIREPVHASYENKQKEKKRWLHFKTTQWKLLEAQAPSDLCALVRIDPSLWFGCVQRAEEAAQERDQGQRMWRDKETRQLFKDLPRYHLTEWQAFRRLKGKQLSAFHHGGLIGGFLQGRRWMTPHYVAEERPRISTAEKPRGKDTPKNQIQ